MVTVVQRRPSPPMNLKLFAASVALLPTGLFAATFGFSASNVGPLTDGGRDLQFEIQGVDSEIRAAHLRLRLNYSAAHELAMRLVDVPGAVELPLFPHGMDTGAQFSGVYVLDDRALTTMEQLRTGSAAVPNVASRAYQTGVEGQCLNMIGRFLEFDRNRNGLLTLSITRTPEVTGGGSGSISEATLVIDTAEPDELHASGFEESVEALTPCRRPAFDLTFNGGVEASHSPLAILDFSADALPQMNWSALQLSPAQSFGPVSLGTNRTPVYAGRFGGRSRMNFGYWDEATGTLNFTTGAGARFLELPGDWDTTEHFVIPGDYDGDGITDLAMAFLANGAWTSRILFSRSGQLLDQIIDPRVLSPTNFSSGSIGFGAGQDADLDGRDEIFIYARQSSSEPQMRMLQIVPFTPDTPGTFFDGPSWGIFGDELVLGRWSTSTSGNRLGMMVVRKNLMIDRWQWFRFPDSEPVDWGLASVDLPVSIDVDGDGQNDLAVYRRSDQRWYVIQSSDAAQVTLGPFGTSNGWPLGTAQGLTAPLAF